MMPVTSSLNRMIRRLNAPTKDVTTVFKARRDWLRYPMELEKKNRVMRVRARMKSSRRIVPLRESFMVSLPLPMFMKAK